MFTLHDYTEDDLANFHKVLSKGNLFEFKLNRIPWPGTFQSILANRKSFSKARNHRGRMFLINCQWSFKEADKVTPFIFQFI